MLEINNQNYKEEGKLEKILLSVSIGVFLSVLFLVKPFSIPLAGLIIFLLIIAWKVKIENFIKIFILLYPIMPFHAGVDLGFMLPVVKLHRVFILLLILCWLKNKKGIKLKSFLQFPLTRVLGIMLGVYFIAFMVRFNLKGFIFSSSTLVLENFMIIYIFYDVFKNKRIEEIKTIYKYLMISAIILLFLGIVEWITHFNVFSFISPYREVLEGAVRMQGRFGIGRVKAAFPHPLDYGVFFAMVAPAGLLFLKSKEIDTKKKNYSLMYVCFFAICFLGCYLSLSRLALIAFLISALFISLYFNFAKTAFYSIFAIMLLIMCPFNFAGIQDKIIKLLGSIFNPGYASSDIASSTITRFYQLKVYWVKILEAPFFGYGGTYDPGIIDNYYLTLSLKIGFVGLLSYLLFFFYPMMLAFKMFLRSTIKFEKYAAFCTIVILASNLLVFSVLSITEYLYLTWIYIGIFLATREIYKREKI